MLPLYNLVARARDPLWEESWGSGKKPKRMHRIHCIPLLSDPVHWTSAQYLSFLTMEPLQGVENDIARKNYVPSSFRNTCPRIKTLNHIGARQFSICYEHMVECNLHCVIFPCAYTG